MRIGELAQVSGTPVRTIRYYEEIELLPVAARSESGYRVFTSEHVRRLRFIRSARGLGLSLDQIREILSAASQENPPCMCVRSTIQRSIEQIDRRIDDLVQMRSDLVRTVTEIDKSTPADADTHDGICPAIESVSGTHPRTPLDSPVDWKV